MDTVLKQAGGSNVASDARSRCGKTYEKKNVTVSDNQLRMLNPSRRQAELQARKSFGDDGLNSASHKREQEFETALKKFAKNTGPGAEQERDPNVKKATD